MSVESRRMHGQKLELLSARRGACNIPGGGVQFDLFICVESNYILKEKNNGKNTAKEDIEAAAD